MPEPVVKGNLVGTGEDYFDIGLTGDYGFRIDGDDLKIRDKKTGEHTLEEYLAASSFDETKIVTDRGSGSVMVDRVSGNIMMFQ